MQIKKLQLELDMEQLMGSKLGKEYKAVYCHPAYLTICRVHLMLFQKCFIFKKTQRKD